MKLIADGGSTKTEWCLCSENKLSERFFTEGLNPYILDDENIRNILTKSVMTVKGISKVRSIYFYGAGCRDVAIPRMKSVFSSVFGIDDINIYSDVVASARALFGNSCGIACILGTGSNSCYYNGTSIVKSVPPMGYVLGDEGSGADIGKHLVNAVFKHRIPEMLCDMFVKETGLTLDDVIRRTYREAEPGKFLASFTHFAADHIEHKEIYNIVKESFVRFFRNNISSYNIGKNKIGAVGSVAFYFKNVLQEAAIEQGYNLDKVIKSPMDELLVYHGVKENK